MVQRKKFIGMKTQFYTDQSHLHGIDQPKEKVEHLGDGIVHHSVSGCADKLENFGANEDLVCKHSGTVVYFLKHD